MSSKYPIVFFLILLLVILSCACFFSAPETEETLHNLESIVLWIVTEETTTDGMNHQLKNMIEQFSNSHPNISFKVDVLPTDKIEREQYINELYALMESGKGPDIFLLPTSDLLVLDHPRMYTYLRVKPLFPDVNVAMRKGYFMDISDLYNADTTLGKTSLNTVVMNAGIVDNKRYTLPLRYDAPIIYIWGDSFNENGIDISRLDGGIISWMEYVIEKGDPLLACGGEYGSIQVFSNINDYEKERIVLTHNDIEQYLKLYQQIQTLIGTEYNHRTSAILSTYMSGNWTKFPVQINMLGRSLNYVAISEVEQDPISMYPLRTVDGDWVGVIKYYAAIGGNCNNSDLAYEFIRKFLLEESQWEKNRLKPETEQYPGLLVDSFPVRINGSVEPLWNNLKMQQIATDYSKSIENTTLTNKLKSLKLTDSSLPVLSKSLDAARFPPYLSQPISFYLSQLNNYEGGNNATNVNISELAKMIIDDLKCSTQ